MNESLRMQLNKEDSAVRCTLVSPYYIDTGECARVSLKDGLQPRYLLALVLQGCLMAPGRAFRFFCRFSSRRLLLVGSSRLCAEMLLSFRCHHLCTRPT